MGVALATKLSLAALVVAWTAGLGDASIMSKAFFQWTKDQYLLNGSSFHGWCALEGHWRSPWNSATAIIRKRPMKYFLEIGTSQMIKGRVKLVGNATTLATHLRGKPVRKGKKQLYVADVTCAKVGNKDHLYAVVLPVGGLRSSLAFYDMIRSEGAPKLRPIDLSSTEAKKPIVYMSEKEANPNPL
ncbi:hypothetical protein E2C01_002356 [Portunus trituberculatus]|uniref:Uncharacterized protein n=1 Tax=Portunus trituberculatus TaxID=210409 RepID=A0A5B7CJH3_PORTR|nr:hypothetical protein [Portunus trituberculatus]